MKRFDTPVPYGSGGGGGKGGSDSKDTLFSHEYIQIVDLIGEGPIRAIGVNGLQSLFINNTKLQNSDGTFTIKNVDVQSTLGLPDQAPLSGFPDVEAEDVVNVKVFKDSPITRTTSDPDVDEIRVTIRVPALFHTNKKGEMKPSSVSLKIEYQATGGDWITAFTDTISGKCSSPYDKPYRFKLTGEAPWDIRVTRLSDDSDDPKSPSDIYWQSATRIKDIKMSYADSVVSGISADAQYFSGVPARKWFGDWLICSVPSNYDPDARTYTGIWDGTFQSLWTQNPAWVLYEILDNKRWGLRKYLPNITIDKWALYAIAQYCDEMVDDGYGGTEPRYTFNGGFATADDAIRGVQTVAGLFRGMVYVSAGQVIITADMPGDVVKEFNQTNVIDGKFVYSGVAKKTRHNAVYVTWFNPDLQGDKDTEAFQRTDLIKRYGYIPTDVVAVGCTSRGQALRTAKWIIETDNFNTETVSFACGYMHADCRPGQIIAVADPAYQGIRAGGRLKGLVISAGVGIGAILDAPLTIVGSGHSLHFTQNDGSIISRDIVEADTTTDVVTFTANVDLPTDVTYFDTIPWDESLLGPEPPPPPPGTAYVYTISDGTPSLVTHVGDDGITRLVVITLPDTPFGGSVWLYYGHVVPRQFRVVSVKENSQEDTFDITALLHDPDKYARVEQGIFFDSPPTSVLVTPVEAPTNITFNEYQYVSLGKSGSRLTVSWTHSPTANKGEYQVYSNDPKQGLRKVGSTDSNSMDFDDLEAGDYVFAVTATNSAGHESQPLQGSITAMGWEGNMPLAIENLHVVNDTGTDEWNSPDVTIQWDNVFDGDIRADAMANPFYKNTRLRFYDTATMTLARELFVRAEAYTYKLPVNNKDFGGTPERDLTIEAVLFDTIDRQSDPVTLAITNAAPEALTVTAEAGYRQFIVTLPIVPDLDFKGYLVWVSTTSGFTPGPGNLKYDGASTSVVIPGTPGVTYYIVAAAYDTFSKSDLNLSTEISVVPTAISQYTTAYITSDTTVSCDNVTWADVVSITITSTGSPVLVVMNFYAVVIDSIYWQIIRGTDVLAVGPLGGSFAGSRASFSLSEPIAAGSHTYTLQIVNQANASVLAHTVKTAGIIATEINT